MSRRQSHEVRSNRKSALIGTLIGWTMKLVAATLRLEVRDRCGVGKPELAVPPVIYILWHNRFFTVPAAWNKICRKHRRSVTLTSASHDGDMVARAMAVFGLGAVRGSSSRRAVAALVGLRQALRDGTDVGLTPDGLALMDRIGELRRASAHALFVRLTPAQQPQLLDLLSVLNEPADDCGAAT